MKVEIKVDMKRRENLKRLHTATHIINFCSKQILGNHIWQNGSNLKEDSGSLDITHFEILKRDEIEKIENLANCIVFENKKVIIEHKNRVKAEEEYGFKIYQGGAVPSKDLRLIKVSNYDTEACCGLHVENTGEIGLIKITNVSKIQDGVIRLTYTVHNFALKKINEDEKILSESSNILSVEKDKLLKSINKFFNEVKTQKKKIELFQKEVKTILLEKIKKDKLKEIKVNDFDMNFLIEFFNEVLKIQKDFTLENKNLIISTNKNIKGSFLEKISKKDFIIYKIKNE